MIESKSMIILFCVFYLKENITILFDLQTCALIFFQMHFCSLFLTHHLLGDIQFFDKLNEIIIQNVGQFQCGKMSTVWMISAMDQFWELWSELPVEFMSQIVFEPSTSNWYLNWNSFQLQASVFCCERFCVQTHRSGDAIRQVVEHEIVKESIFGITLFKSAVIQITILRIGPCREFFKNICSQTSRIVGQCSALTMKR